MLTIFLCVNLMRYKQSIYKYRFIIKRNCIYVSSEFRVIKNHHDNNIKVNIKEFINFFIFNLFLHLN